MGYEDDTAVMVGLGSGAHKEQLKRLDGQFLLGDPEKINVPIFHKDPSDIPCRVEVQN